MRKFLISLLLLSSCGGPEFAVSYSYIPPKGGNGCLKRCQENYERCRSSCADSYRKCIERSREKALSIYREEVKTYRKELSSYREAYGDYERALSEWNSSYAELERDYAYFKTACRQSNDRYACERKEELEEALRKMERGKPSPPRKPKKPEFSSLFNEIKSSCDSSCGCREDYNRCFTSCGGTLIPHKFCIKNCK